jgi:hypothetical protein
MIKVSEHDHQVNLLTPANLQAGREVDEKRLEQCRIGATR